jgi:hypothetical protein
MNEKTELVVNGFLALTDTEKAVVYAQIARIQEGRSSLKRLQESEINKALKVVSGPLGGGCPCCGSS